MGRKSAQDRLLIGWGRKMTKPKPLPYKAGQLIDAALMENKSALNSLLPLVDNKPIPAEEKVGRVAQAIHHIHESSSALKEAKKGEDQ